MNTIVCLGKSVAKHAPHLFNHQQSGRAPDKQCETISESVAFSPRVEKLAEKKVSQKECSSTMSLIKKFENVKKTRKQKKIFQQTRKNFLRQSLGNVELQITLTHIFFGHSLRLSPFSASHSWRRFPLALRFQRGDWDDLHKMLKFSKQNQSLGWFKV